MQILAYSSSVLEPQSPEAIAVFDLGIVSVVVFALIWIIVTGSDDPGGSDWKACA